jgi:hypothetical protein
MIFVKAVTKTGASVWPGHVKFFHKKVRASRENKCLLCEYSNGQKHALEQHVKLVHERLEITGAPSVPTQVKASKPLSDM